MLQARLLLLVSGLAFHLCGIVSMEMELIKNAPLWAKTIVLFQYYGLGVYPVFVGLTGSDDEIQALLSVVLAGAPTEVLKVPSEKPSRFNIKPPEPSKKPMIVFDLSLYSVLLLSFWLLAQRYLHWGAGLTASALLVGLIRYQFFKSPFRSKK